MSFVDDKEDQETGKGNYSLAYKMGKQQQGSLANGWRGNYFCLSSSCTAKLESAL